MARVLVVDDDKRVCECLEGLIDWQGLECEFAGMAYNGEQAYSMIDEQQVDILITDLKMPVMGGVELLKKLHENHKNVVTIFLSAYEDFSAAQLGMEYNVKRYILKPLDQYKIKEITETVSEINDQLSKEQYLHYLLSGRSFEHDVKNNLETGNYVFFESFFAEMEENFSEQYSLLSAVCLKIINLLYEYLKTLGFNEKSVENGQMTINETVNKLGGTKSIIDFTWKMIQNVFSVMPKKVDTVTKFIEEIKEYLNENYNNPDLYLPVIAERFGFSQQHIRRLFKNETGTTITGYIARKRIEKSEELLLKTDMLIKDIAECCGFTDSHNFISCFSRVYKKSPGKYREDTRARYNEKKENKV